ncbi:MAG TPA: 3D domain-containing protein [Solirubrobacteraceae bacterium]
MLGQAHTPRRRFLPFAAVALVVLAAPTVSGAFTSHGVVGLRAHDASLAAKSRSAVLGLYSLDQQLAAAQSRLSSLHAQQQSLRAQRAEVAHRLAIAKRGTQLSQVRLGTRLRQLYEQGDVEPLEIVFGAKSLDEALANLDNLSRATGQGEDILRELEAARASASSAARTLAAKDAALTSATQAAESTAAALASQRTARNAYISSLAAQRRLTQQQISTVVAQASAARIRSAQLARVSADAASAAPITAYASAPLESGAAPTPDAVSPGAQSITVSATGYSLPGRTATGLPAGWGVVAVDPSVIPLGTHMSIPGYGEAVAADTGGAIVGSTIDLWFPSVGQANAWGRRTVTITLH